MNFLNNDLIDRKMFLYLLVLTIILISTPILINVNKGHNFLLSPDAYHHLRLIDQYKQSSNYKTDMLQNRPLKFNLFYYIISILNIPDSFVVNILPILLGILAFSIFYNLLKLIKFKNTTLLFSSIMLISSPLFISTFSTINPDSFYIVIFLIAAYLYVKKSYFSLIFSALLAVLSISYFLVFVLVTFIKFIHSNWQNKKLFFYNLFFGVTSVIIYFNLIKTNIAFFDLFSNSATINSIFLSLGSINGYAGIFVLLIIIGMFIFWKRTFSNLIIYILFILLFILAIQASQLRLIIVFIGSLFAGKAISYLIYKKWNIPMLKSITLLLIVCSLLFSVIVFLKTEVDSVNPNFVRGTKFLSTVNVDNVILSSEKNGFIIEQIGKRTAFLDSESYKYADYDKRQKIADEIFYTRDLKLLKERLQETGINTIFVSKNMFNGQIWNSPDEGVLFLLKNSKDFVKTFDNKEVQIYQFIGE